MREKYVYLADKPGGIIELYLNGIPSGTLLKKRKIRKLLTRTQWKEFKKGQRIFYIEEDRLPELHDHNHLKIKP